MVKVAKCLLTQIGALFQNAQTRIKCALHVEQTQMDYLQTHTAEVRGAEPTRRS